MLWRCIPPIVASGSFQMALDEWLLDQHGQHRHPPTLRFYTWMPPAISLGYHQRRFPTEWQSLTWKGTSIDLVRRPSGGRAVLHQGDLTYAIITSGLTGSRSQIYQQLCEFLIQGWQAIGVPLQFGEAGRGYIQNPNCFGTATGADLVMSDGAKLVGSAQLYRHGAVLQHGSMPLNMDAALFEQVFGSAPNLPKLPPRSLDTVINALTQAAISCFAMEFMVQPLTQLEWETIAAQAQAQSHDSRS